MSVDRGDYDGAVEEARALAATVMRPLMQSASSPPMQMAAACGFVLEAAYVFMAVKADDVPSAVMAKAFVDCCCDLADVAAKDADRVLGPGQGSRA